uniref:ectonucleotide pyrophosphatase/phosphodiesterase family member 7-like n=1 Tax=Ciona intestinalis TaxID=7719 RepID=UPI000180D1FA|nr:ectonucleotide pyrophosphatase/phosphodiesterase family member 7-like [Ciona intestinalis]|eukprot:XP_002121836.1 ectonucleotide pyrophosphatase/phosphodiesterase family member 7-like [Ciona intestinalis]
MASVKSNKVLSMIAVGLMWYVADARNLFVDRKEAKPHKLLLVSFDGFKWDYADRTPELEAFQYLRANGVTADYIQGPYPTQTSPSHFTIATGLYTESHGVVHNCYFNISEQQVRDTFYTTLAVNEWWDNGAEPIWITAVNQGLRSGGYMFPGSYASIGGVTATKRILETSDTPFEESDWRVRIDETMKWFNDDGLDMIALYFEQPDVYSHRYGPDSPGIANKIMPLLNRTIMYLIEKVEEAGLTDDLNIIITSDHGFTEIDKTVGREDAISLAQYVNQSFIDFQFAYSAIALVEPKPGYEEYVRDELQKGNPHMQVFLKQDLPERLHYTHNDRIPSIVIKVDPGYAAYQIFPGIHVNAGEHGYDNNLESMRASYYSIGPSFKKNYSFSGFETVNMYPLMCHLLGLEPAPNNGSLSVLMETLVSESETTTLKDRETTGSSTTIPLLEQTTTGSASKLNGANLMLVFMWLLIASVL